MGHDLDDEELRATRRMFGLDRKENKVISREYVEENYIHKDKIIEVLGLEENDDITEKGILSYIEILVDECNRLEDIEDRKVQIEYNNVFNKGVKSVEDKIREKIDYLIKEADYRTVDNPKGRIHFHKEPCDYQIEVLKELLGE